MNKIILIGNGFDLAHGLKTRYDDFILWYLNKAFNFHKNRRENPYQHDDGLVKINAPYHYDNAKFDSVKDFYEKKKTFNMDVKYTHPFVESIFVESHQKNWVDIEAAYYSSLIELYKLFENRNRRPEAAKALEELNNCFERIKIELEEYLSTIQIDSKIQNSEINSLLKKEMDSIYTHDEILFLNFNYTSTIELYFKSNSGWPCRINNIHGSLRDESNPIIFGYGDEMDTHYEKIEQLNSNKFLNNIKSFGYFKTNNYQDFTGFMELGGFTVSIMGHSCGLSDRILLNSIFEHPNCQKIQIFYYEKSDLENDFFEKTQEISRHYRPIHKGRMRDMIVPFSDSKPLIKYKI